MAEQEVNPQNDVVDEQRLAFWGRHRLAALLAASITIALLLTSVSLMIYNSSGAAQLDLSRPGYRSVSNKVEKSDTFKEFSSSGAIDKETIKQFMKQYDEQAAKAKAVDAFSGDPLNPETLEFNSPADGQANS